jgi:hypothetical protein
MSTRSVGLFVPNGPRQFINDSGIYLPRIYSADHKKALLRDYGLGFALTHERAFGSAWPRDAVLGELSQYDPLIVVEFASRVARDCALRGSRDLSDEMQRAFFEAACADASAVGLPLLPDADREHGTSFYPETSHALVLLTLLSARRGSQMNTGVINIDRIARICLANNGEATGATRPNQSVDRRFHLENLRRAWVQGPFLGAAQSTVNRMRRFEFLLKRVLSRVTHQVRAQLEDGFSRSYGVDPETFLDLIPVLHASWLAGEKQAAFLRVEDVRATGSSDILRLMKALSLSFDRYVEAVDALGGESVSLQDQRWFALLARRPFIEFPDGRFTLVGPHLLLRSIELSLTTAFYEHKPRQQEIRDLLGPMGEVAEEYAQEMIATAASQPSVGSSVSGWTPPRGQGPGDFVVIGQDIAAVFEIKFRQPPLAALAPSPEGQKLFDAWIDSVYLSQQSPLGALAQLSRDVRRVRSGEVNRIYPDLVLPVLVNPQELPFAYDIYQLADEVVSEDETLAKDPRVLPYLVLGLDDLEWLAGLTYAKRATSLMQVLSTKARNPAARLTGWMRYLIELRLEYQATETSGDQSIERALACLSRDGVLVSVPVE